MPACCGYAVWMTEDTGGERVDDDAAAPWLRLEEQVSDLGRVVARQGRLVERLLDAADRSPGAPGAPAQLDMPLLVELHALYTDAAACRATATSESEAAAFAALCGGLERLIVGRGGAIISPGVGADFDPRTMEAAEVRAATDEAEIRQVVELLRPGLLVAERAVRPALVVVYR